MLIRPLNNPPIANFAIIETVRTGLTYLTLSSTWPMIEVNKMKVLSYLSIVDSFLFSERQCVILYTLADDVFIVNILKRSKL